MTRRRGAPPVAPNPLAPDPQHMTREAAIAGRAAQLTEVAALDTADEATIRFRQAEEAARRGRRD